MDHLLEEFLIEDRLQQIKVTIKAVKSTGEVVDIVVDLEKYIELFAYDYEFGECELYVLNEEYLTQDEIDLETVFTKASISGYDFDYSIKFAELMNVCNILSDCDSNEDRTIVMDFLTCVSCLGDNITFREIDDRLAYRDRDDLIESLKDDCGVDPTSNIFNYIDFEQFADDVIRYDLIETKNCYLFSY